MRIIQYIERFYPTLGGGETHVADIVETIPEYDFEIITNALPRCSSIEQYSNNTVIHRFPPTGNLPLSNNKAISKAMFPYRVFSEWLRLQRKYQYLKNHDFDILHVHIPFLNLLLRSFRYMGIHRFDKLVNFSFLNQPKLLTWHTLSSHFTNDLFIKDFERYMVKSFDNMICVDEYIYLPVKKYASELSKEKNIYFIPNSVNTEKFRFEPLREREKLHVCFIGRLEKDRKLILLKDLINNLPPFVDFTLIVTGSPSELEIFKVKFKSPNVHLYTNVRNEEIPEFIRKSDVVFNPVTGEGIGRITLEGMSSGRPIIMIDRGNRHPVIHNKTGFLIEDNVESLLQQLNYIHNNRSRLTDISINAREIIDKEFATSVIMPKIRGIYDLIV